jgi:pimeloyl-ACP methyl ester carboxylesterase
VSAVPPRAVTLVPAVGCALGAFAPAADARATRIVIDPEPSPADGGKSFVRAGPHERVTGRAFGEIDPRDPRNPVINDLDLAPRNARAGATSSSRAAGRATSAGGRGPRRSPFRWPCAALAGAGWAVWSVEYRRVGEEGGGWPNTLLDVATAADHLRALAPAHRLDLGRAVAVGHSAGGHLALWLAARRRLPPGHALHRPDPLPLRGAVALAGVCDLRRAHELGLGVGAVPRLLGGGPEAVPDRYAGASPADLVPLGTRQVLVHGAADSVVPVDISRAYRATAAAAGDVVELVEVAGAGHFEVINADSPAWPSVAGALARFR